MTDRLVKIILRGDVDGFKASMRAAGSSVSDVAGRMTGASKEGEKFRRGLTAFGSTAGKFGLVAAGGVAVAVRAFANFDQAMSSVKATGKDAAKSIDALRAASIKAGADTQYSATEAANGVENLAKAGVSAADILGGGLSGALNLAAAGQLGVADAAEITATALQQFQLPGTQASHVADLLAAAAGKAQGDVGDFAYALKYAGVPAKALGVSIEETTGALALFASKGILGEQAGTNLRSIMLSLAAPTKIASKVMKQYGLELYDSKGKFVGLGAAAAQLHDKLGKLSDADRNQALSKIFGQNAIQGAITLYEGGGKAVKDWTKQVNDAGFAAEVAATKMDNLKGDWEQLTGSLETALIGVGQGSDGPLRGLLQDVTGLVNAFNELPDPIKSTTLKAGALTAVLGGGLFAVSRSITGYANMRSSLTDLGFAQGKATAKGLAMKGGLAAGGLALIALSGQAEKAGDGLGGFVSVLGGAATGFALGGPWGAAIGGAGAAVAAFAGNNKSAVADVQSLTNSLDAQSGALSENTKNLITNGLQKSGAYKLGRGLGLAQGAVTDAGLGSKSAVQKIIDARNAAAASYGAAVRAGTAGTGHDFGKDVTQYDALLKILGQQTDALGDAKSAWTDRNKAQAQSFELNKVTADQIVKVTAAVKGIPKEVATKFTQPGYVNATENAAEIAHKYKLTPKEVSTALKALDYTKPQIAAVLAAMKRLDKTTAHPKVKVWDEASTEIRRIQGLINGMNGKTVRIVTQRVDGGIGYGGGITKASGGYISGAGTGTSDSIPAMLSNGEYVINAKSTAANLDLLHSINARKYAQGGLVAAERFSNGGQVSASGIDALNIALRKMLGTVSSLATATARFDKFSDLSGSKASKLDLVQKKVQIYDLGRDLSEREKYKSHGKTRTRLKLRGLDREAAKLELADAKTQLSTMNATNKALKSYGDMKSEQLRFDRAKASADFAGNASIGSLSSVKSVDRELTKTISNLAAFTLVMSQLKAKGASPWLLDQLQQAGPTDTSIRLAKSYLADSNALARVNAQSKLLTSVSGAYGTLTTDPKWTSAPAAQVLSQPTQKTLIQIQTLSDSQLATEVSRQVRFALDAQAVGGGV